MDTVVPRSGRARSMLGKDEGMSREQPFYTVSEMSAGERGAGYILDIPLQRKLCAVALTDELRSPHGIADLAPIGLPIFEDLDPANAAVCLERQGIGDIVVPADHLIDDE